MTSTPTRSVSPQRQIRSSIRSRYAILPLLFVLMLFAWFDRANVSVEVTDSRFLTQFGLHNKPVEIGLLLTVFSVTYGVAGLFIAPLIDRFKARRILIVSAVLWSLTMIALAFSSTLPQLLVGRAVLGLAESVQFACNGRLVRNWFRKKEQARVNVVWLLGVPFGSAAGLPLVAVIVAGLGWQAGFWVLALFTLVLLPALIAWLHDDPSDAKWVSRSSAAAVGADGDGAASAGEKRASLRKAWNFVRRSPDWWLAMLQDLFLIGLLYGLLQWLPTYLLNARHIAPTTAGVLAGTIFIAQVVGMVAGSFASDWTKRRAIVLVASFVVSGVFLALAAWMVSDAAAIVMLYVAVFGFGLSYGSNHTISQNVVPRKNLVGTLYGWNLGIGNIGGAFAPLGMGAVIGATGSYEAGILLLVGVCVIGAGFAVALVARGH